MILKKNFAFFIIIIFFIIHACTSDNSQYQKTEIEVTLDSLKNIYAPDKRIALWHISIKEIDNKIKVKVEVDNRKAQSEIINTLKRNFPSIEAEIILLPETENEQLITGLINNSVANLRSNPWHSAEISTQALLGTPIKILKKENGWYLIQIPNKYIAWTDAANIVRINENELIEFKQSKKVIYNKQYGFSYSKPNSNSQVISDLAIGCILAITGSEGVFFKVQYPDKRNAYVKKSEVVDASTIFNKSINPKKLVETAKKFNGIPYLWGGTSSKGIDCSGFTSSIYYLNGIILQRDASQQTKYGREISTNTDYEKLLPGDLLFFGRKVTDSLPEKVTHVAMYIGESEFIHASGRVRINSMDSSRNDYAARYLSHIVRTIRINGEPDGKGIQKIIENEFYKEIISN